MTIAELKDALRDAHDDMPVVLHVQIDDHDPDEPIDDQHIAYDARVGSSDGYGVALIIRM